MVARIESGESLSGALLYNERKVSKGEAKILDAKGFHLDAAHMTTHDKLHRLKDLAQRNHRTTTNTVHISLNFEVNERLEQDTLIEIADRYMEGIGFGEQPYLIYQHLDSGHPHLHLLTTNIRPDGKRISLHNLGRSRSEPVRKQIEKDFRLVVADGRKEQGQQTAIPPPVIYGDMPTKRALGNVANYVVRNYRFTSLVELNAALRRFHVLADPGNEGSNIARHRGLRYWVTNVAGDKVGVPIKASSLYGKPTLTVIQRAFLLNEALRKPLRSAVIIKIDRALSGASTLAQLQQNLSTAAVEMILRRNEDGRVFGVTFVDHEVRSVFKGSDLGKNYSIGNITARLAASDQVPLILGHKSLANTSTDDRLTSPHTQPGILSALFHSEQTYQDAQVLPTGRKRRKKKRRLNL